MITVLLALLPASFASPPPARPAAVSAYRDPGQSLPMSMISRGPDPDINAEPLRRARQQLERCARHHGARTVQDRRCAPGGDGY